MKAALPLILTLTFTGCAHTNNYARYYQQYKDPSQIRDVEFLAEGQEPQPYFVKFDEVSNAIMILRSKGYVGFGGSAFNGPKEDPKNAIEQAKRLRAVALIIGSAYTDTRTATMLLPLPTTQTTYGSGTVSSSTGAYGTYSGTSTTYGSTVVPVASSTAYHNQGAVYFLKSTKKHRFGALTADLTLEQREALGRNTGAYVQVVVEKTPAFYANMLPGDVIIAVDGKEARSHEEAQALMENVPQSSKTSVLTVLRSGNEKKVAITFHTQ